MNNQYDVIIIGAGVSGSACARELSRFNLKIAVLEMGNDVCTGTSKANSGIVHSGIDCKTGSLMAKLNLKGNEMMEQLSKDLDFGFIRNGSLILMFDEADRPRLEALYNQGVANGVKGLKILNYDEVKEMEPNISDDVVAAIYAPSGGIVDCFGLNIALAENAAVNGVEFIFDCEVTNIHKPVALSSDISYLLNTSKGEFTATVVINAAGVYADKFHNMVSQDKIHITARKGEYCLFDTTVGDMVKSTIFQLPTDKGKGVLVTPTVHGNLLMGPTADDHEDKDNTCTTAEGLSRLLSQAGKSVKEVPRRQIITSFAGNRAHEDGHEFIIGEVKDSP